MNKYINKSEWSVVCNVYCFQEVLEIVFLSGQYERKYFRPIKSLWLQKKYYAWKNEVMYLKVVYFKWKVLTKENGKNSIMDRILDYMRNILTVAEVYCMWYCLRRCVVKICRYWYLIQFMEFCNILPFSALCSSFYSL